MTNARDKANIPVLNFQSKGITVSDANTSFVYVEENTGNAGDTAGILFKTSAADGFFKSGIILEDDGTTYARGKLHIVQNSLSNSDNAIVSDAKITILNNGNVGIGTDSPSAKLHVDDSGGGYMKITRTGTSGGIFLETDGTHAAIRSLSSTGSLKFQTNGNNEKMRISSDGKVGIGTSSPVRTLDISDTTSGATTGIRLIGANNGSQVIEFADTDDVNVGYIQYDHGNNVMAFRVNDNERMRISSAGLVSIGNTNASSFGSLATDLVIGTTSGEHGLTIVTGTGNSARMQFSDNTSSPFRGAIEYSHGSDDLMFYTDGSQKMKITSAGNIGIGTTSPTVPLEVLTNLSSDTQSTPETVLTLSTKFSSISADGAAGSGSRLEFKIPDDETNPITGAAIAGLKQNGDDSSAEAALAFYISQNDTTLDEAMRINSSGHIIAPLLNTTGSTNNRYPLYWVHTGTTGSIEPYTGSIRAMKTDINDMGSVDWIHSLTPRSFKFRDYETDEDGNRTYLETTNDLPNTEYGLIAEEVNEVNGSDYILDKQIDEDGNENLKGVLYHNLVPVLLKAVQEQKNTIQELEARITTLETTTP